MTPSSRLAVLSILAALSSNAVNAADHSILTLTLPGAFRDTTHLSVEIESGPIPAGSRLVVSTEKGEAIGAVAPFGTRPGHPPAKSTIALPPIAVQGGQLRLHVHVESPGGTSRALSAQELQTLKVTLPPP